MVLAKKIKFGQTANTSSNTLVNPVDGSLYIPITGYTKSEVQSAWNATTIIEMPNKFAELGIIGAGGSCYNPGFGSGSIFDLNSYAVFCDAVYNPDCIMPHIDAVPGTINTNAMIGYCNNDGDGIFFNSSAICYLVVDGVRKTTPKGGGWRCFNLAHGGVGNNNGVILFLFLTYDGYVGLVQLSTAGNVSSWLDWFTLQESNYIMDFLETLEPLPEDEDPFTPGGVSEPETEPGEFERDGEDVDIPALPTLSAVQSNFITVYNPTLAQLQNLSTYLWSSDIADVLKKLFSDPMSAILGLSIVPVNVPNSGAREVYIGNVATGVTMNLATSQYVEIDCGTAILPLYFGAYLDYSPYTKIEVYLPYIGVRALDADEIVGKTIAIKYHVDILSGACCAYIKVNGTVLYTFIGQCSAAIPITGRDFTSVVNGVLNIAGAIGSTVATGGATAPAAASSIVSTAFNGSMKPQIEKSGAVSGVGGFFGVQKPYLIVTTPRQCLPAKQNKFIGYPSFVTLSLDSLSGYTEIEKVHLENIPCTDDELNEIENLLKEGVIF